MTAPRLASELLYLARGDVLATGLTDGDVVDLVRTALVEHGWGRCEMPAKIGLHPLKDTIMHAMPAYVPARHACGLKWASSFPQNTGRGLAQTSGLYVLNDENSGWPLAVMDASWITARRTPAVSVLACEQLAPQTTQVLGIIGCGVQGSGHLEMLPSVLPNLREVRLYDARADAAERLAEQFKNATVHVSALRSVEALVRGSQVLVSATAILATPVPLVRDEWIEPGALILPVDFDSVWEWETLARADKFIVDSVAEMEYFHSIGYLPNGLPPVHAEIGQVVGGIREGRAREDELIVNMNIGMGVEDVVVAREVYDRAVASGVGTILSL